MRITIKVKPRAAAELAGAAPLSAPTESLLAAVREAQAVLQPTHPGVDDAELRTWFHADVGDEARYRQLLDRLQREDAIESAYVKPLDEPP